MQPAKVLGVAHGVASGLGGLYAALAAPLVLSAGLVLATVALACLLAAGPAVLTGVLRHHRGALRVASLLQGAAALLLLGQDVYIPAAVAALLFAGSVALALRMPPRDAAPQTQR